jgi:hypothetical protein
MHITVDLNETDLLSRMRHVMQKVKIQDDSGVFGVWVSIDKVSTSGSYRLPSSSS